MRNILYSIVLLFCLVVSVVAQVPRVISYQGVLVGADGKPESGTKNLTISIVDNSGVAHPSGFQHTEPFILNGGLFFARLGQPPQSNMPFPTLEGQWYLKISDGTIIYDSIPLYSTASALNIADNVVTSEKIKDGEVKAEDLHDMGASVGQVLTRTSTSWQGANLPKELPQATEGQILVFKNGSWQAENPTIPSSVPVGTVLPYMGDGFDLTKLQSEGWFLCDGRSIAQIGELSSSEKDTLQNILSRAGVVNAGNLPDLRGYFLRGADRGQGRDPDFGGRLGNGEKIGSSQQDAFQGHGHKFTWHCDALSAFGSGGRSDWPRWMLGDAKGDENAATGLNCRQNKNVYEPQTLQSYGLDYGTARYTTETRPKNVYVNYIIKAK